MRVMGKRQIGELQPSELVVTILISELAAIPMQETGVPLVSGVVPVLTLIACEVILSAVTLRWRGLRRLISGQPIVIVENGRIRQNEMRRLRYSIDDLLEEVRLAGLKGIDEVGYAVIETNGQVSVFPTAQGQPATAAMLGQNPPDGGIPLVLISDGELLTESLTRLGRDAHWLQTKLHEKRLAMNEVFLMTSDRLDNTVIIAREIGGGQ